jgi:hypothetical protein
MSSNENETNETNEKMNENETNEKMNENETNETNEINNTKEENINLKGFLKNYFYVIIFGFIFIGVILIGTVGLYLTKVSVSDILPSNIKLPPFRDVSPQELQEEIQKKAKIVIMNPIKIRTFFGLGIWDEPIQSYSQKAYFDYKEFMDSFNDSWLGMLRDYATNPQNSLSNFALYMSEVLNSMTSSSFGLISLLFKSLNMLPEWLTMLITIFIFFIFGIIVFFYNVIFGILYHISNFKQYFRDVSIDDENKWEPMRTTSWFEIIFKRAFNIFGILGLIKLFFLICAYFWISFFSILITPVFVTLYTLIKPLTAKYKLDKGEGEYGFWSFLKDNIIYKKTFLLILTTLGLFQSTKTYLGGAFIFALLIGVIIVTFMLGLYNPTIPSNDPTQTLGINIKSYELKIPKQSGGKKKYNIKMT